MPIDSHLSYLEKHAFCPPQVIAPPSGHLGMVVVIPVKDEPEIISCLQALSLCQQPDCDVEVVLVFNAAEEDAASLKQDLWEQLVSAKAWAGAHFPEWMRLHALHFPELPQKHAGIGLARKIGMDEAVHRLHWADNERQLILCLDADCWVEGNYLISIWEWFANKPKLQSCSIGFKFFGLDKYALLAANQLFDAQQSLVTSLRKAGHPYAFMIKGAAMAVRSQGYQAQAGMNRRKVGEDFDFLQKFIELGQHGELEEVLVKISCRPESRKPFGGTGHQIEALMRDPSAGYMYFPEEKYQGLQAMLQRMPNWFGLDQTALESELSLLPASIRAYLIAQNWPAPITEIQKYTRDRAAFQKRFFRWFNSLRCLQYLGN